MNVIAPAIDTSNGQYHYLRQVLSPEYAALSSRALEALMDEHFGSGAAEHYDEYLEGFFDDLGSTFKKVGPIVGNVAGGVARGAMSGSSLGLPGIIGGALAGGAGTALGSYAKGPLRDVGQALNTGVQVASQFSPMGRVGNSLGSALSGVATGGFKSRQLLDAGLGAGLRALGGGASGALGSLLGRGRGRGGAASQLFSLLGRPEVQQALTALNLGHAGRRSVPVGASQTPVPTTAIAGLLQTLAGQAISEAAAESDGAESELAYMADDSGELVGDPTLDHDRAQRVWVLLNQAQLERLETAAWQARAEHPLDCPHCGHDVHVRRRIDPPPAEDFGEDLMEMLEAFDEDTGEFDGEDLGEDLAEDLGDVIVARAGWELPHAYA